MIARSAHGLPRSRARGNPSRRSGSKHVGGHAENEFGEEPLRVAYGEADFLSNARRLDRHVASRVAAPDHQHILATPNVVNFFEVVRVKELTIERAGIIRVFGSQWCP
jgi:hypothetical protein